MSNRRPPEPPPSPNRPKKQTPNDSGGGGFNWRVFILFGIAIAILYAAYHISNSGPNKKFDFAEYQKQYFSGNIYSEDAYKDNKEVLKEYKLENEAVAKTFVTNFTTEKSHAIGQVRGKFNFLDKRDLDKIDSKSKFIVHLDTKKDHEFFAAIDNGNKDITVKWVDSPEEAYKKQDSESAAGSDTNEDTATAVKRKELPSKDLRKFFFRDEIANLTVYKAKDNTERAIVVGDKLTYAELAPQTIKDNAQKKGVTVTDKDLKLGVKFIGFSMTENVATLTDADKAFIKETATYSHNDGGAASILISLLPFLLIILIIFFIFRYQMRNAGKGAMSFGKSKARLLAQDKNKVTFKDVAGIQEAKEELYEIVDFLKGPKKFEVLGGNIPKGILMVGPPGTGKTLLARAIAGEADVPFFSISGSDFVEMFVGVGASRVRDMFEQGKKNSPCIVFIDEIDAVGRHRGHGHGGGHDEREQTLNALLVEMDGFDARSGVIIIAATNRPDVLDPALLRPGRFDRQVTVALPDYKGREQILGVHAKKIKLKEGTDLSTISKGTPGFSGAELANLINEAALLAARKGLKEVTIAELEEARDKVRWGRERRSLAMSEKDKANTAYHEAGHAICNLICDHTDNLHKVTIIPRGPALGMAMFLPEEDRVNYREAELIDQLCVAMGGRVAEELIFGNVTNGAMGDIRQATNIARKMVCEWGMSRDLGMVDYGGDENQEMFMAASKSYSEDTAQKIDLEIKQFIDEAYDRAKQILSDNLEALENIAQALLEYETLNGEQIKDILEKGEMDDPPNSPTPPEPPMAPAADTIEKKPQAEVKEDDDPMAPEAVGAPA